jgi:hypothetical protein
MGLLEITIKLKNVLFDNKIIIITLFLVHALSLFERLVIVRCLSIGKTSRINKARLG